MERVHSMISSCVPFFGREKNEILGKREKIRQEKRERREKEKKRQGREEKNIEIWKVCFEAFEGKTNRIERGKKLEKTSLSRKRFSLTLSLFLDFMEP